MWLWPIMLIFGLGAYAYLAFSLQTIANKTNTENGWIAWIPIPIVGIYLMCKIAGRPGWWVLLSFIPFVQMFILVILWMEIAEARNKPNWLGLLILVPIVNFILPGYLAFSE